MSDHCDAKWLPKPVECLAEPDHAGDHYGEDDAGFVVRWEPKSSVRPDDATGRTFDPETLVLALDAANLEIARLKAGIQKAASRNCDGCWKDRESKKHGHHDHCEARRILADCGLPAALTPKEPSDG